MTRAWMFSLLVGAAMTAAGCHREIGGEAADASANSDMPACTGATSIALSPAGTTVIIGAGPPAPIVFTATATFPDGHTAIVDPATLAWSAARADATPPGTIVAGSLSPTTGAGGVITISATDGCGVVGTTTVTLRLEVTLGTPSDPTAWSGAPTAMGTVPTVVYPSDQTRFPRNIYRTLFQWRTGGHAEFRLTFVGPGSTVTVYSDGTNALCTGKNPAAGCWEADELAWGYIAASNAGATTSVTIDALDKSTTPATVRRATAITIGFSKQDVSGAIFYWSTTSAGVRRANVADGVPQDYITGKPPTTYATPVDQVKCVACHVVSRDGKYIAAPVDATSGKSLWIAEVTAMAPPNPLVKSVAGTAGHGFATFSPDDAQLVAAWKGKMWLLDRITGAKVNDLPLGVLKGTHPDWSPDGKSVVFATGDGDAPAAASLATIPFSAGAWGAPATLLSAPLGKSNLFPMYSHDGAWVAFSQGKGGHGDVSAQLWMVGANGQNAVELVNANRVVNNALGDGQTENSQPTWAPPGDLQWVAFNSKRAYGVVLPPGTQQIWVAAVDPSKLGGAIDPSYPAFRLQFQGLNEDNHRAYWTLDVRDPPPDAGVPGPDMAAPCALGNTACDPLGCCEAGYICDTSDNGATYACQPRIL